MPDTASSRSPKRKLDKVDGSTPTPPVSTTQTKTETVGMDDDTTIVGPGEEKTQGGGGAKKKKKLAVQKCKCLVDGCNKSYHYPGELQEHVDFKHNKIYHNVCDHIDEKGVKCGKKCEQRGALKSHKRHKHSDVCDHQCTDCSSTFKSASARDRHWVTEHSAANDPKRTQYKCTGCTKGFPTSSALDQHFLSRHVPENDPKRRARRDRDNKSKRVNYASDEKNRIKNSLRGALKCMMNMYGMGKVSLSENVMGCSCEQLIAHLNDNDRGFVYEQSGGVFHIDHIRPMASFKNLKCHVEVLKCMNFNNLQLLPGPENKSKKDSFTSDQEAAYAISKGGLAIAELEKGWRADPGTCNCELCRGQTT
jgi:hypothetical protein